MNNHGSIAAPIMRNQRRTFRRRIAWLALRPANWLLRWPWLHNRRRAVAMLWEAERWWDAAIVARLLRAAALVLALASSQLAQADDPITAPIRDAQRNFEVRVRNAKQIRTDSLILQQRDFSCGAAALATIASYFWNDPVSETQVLGAIIATLTKEELDERIEHGLSLTDLKRLAEQAGYNAVLGKLPLERLQESKIPLLVGITVRGYDHFVVVRDVDEQYVYLADPAIGRNRTPIAEFAKQWQRNTVLAIIKPGVDLPKKSSLYVTREERMRGVSNTQMLRTNLRVGF